MVSFSAWMILKKMFLMFLASNYMTIVIPEIHYATMVVKENERQFVLAHFPMFSNQ